MIARCRSAAAVVVALLLCSIALTARAETARGTWNIFSDRGHLALETRWHSDDGSSNEDRSEPFDVQAYHLGSLLGSTGEHGSFAMHRDAGDFTFDGWFANGEASGSYTFTSNEAFFSAVRERGFDAQGIDRKMSFAQLDVTLPFVDAMTAEARKAGIDGLDIHQLLEMKAVGVTPQYIEEIAANGYAHMTARQYVEFKAMSIDGTYLQKLADHGFKNLPARKVVQFKALGIL